MREGRHSLKYWRVFYTRARAEKKCEDRLAKSGVETFLPVRTAMRHWKDRSREVTEPLFANYVFARVNERERLDVLQTDGIVRCVSFSGRVAQVSQTEIDQLVALMNSKEDLEAVMLKAYPEGAEIVVTSGPMKGVRGRVLDHRRRKYLIVEVPSISHGVKMRIPADWVTAPAG